jgi:hypothetical protein
MLTGGRRSTVTRARSVATGRLVFAVTTLDVDAPSVELDRGRTAAHDREGGAERTSRLELPFLEPFPIRKEDAERLPGADRERPSLLRCRLRRGERLRRGLSVRPDADGVRWAVDADLRSEGMLNSPRLRGIAVRGLHAGTGSARRDRSSANTVRCAGSTGVELARSIERDLDGHFRDAGVIYVQLEPDVVLPKHLRGRARPTRRWQRRAATRRHHPSLRRAPRGTRESGRASGCGLP